MTLEIERRERENITILDLRGRIVVGEAAGLLRATLAEIAGAGLSNIILNLAEVDSIDSTGLGALVVSYTSLGRLGGHLKLENLNRRNIELMLFTKLTTVFEIFDDEQHAVNSFFPDRAIKHFDILSFVKEQTGE